MNPSEVNRLNYNCYYGGRNLDALIRQRMKSESVFTPLKVTPKYFNDDVSSKMKLLGNRGHYFPEIYDTYVNVNEQQQQQQHQQGNNVDMQRKDVDYRFTSAQEREDFEKFRQMELERRQREQEILSQAQRNINDGN
jgi:hypothetical protein